VRPTHLAPIPAALERLILRAIAKQAANRPAMADLARELDALAADYLVADVASELLATG
jgi:hypothetical protein